MVKYDSSGNVAWANSDLGLGSGAGGYGISVNCLGEIYVTGVADSTIIFGSDTLTVNTSNSSKPFIVKYDSSGNVIWAKSAGGDGGVGVSAQKVSVDIAGNAYIIGYFDSPTITFGNIIITNNSIDSAPNVFIVKYDSSGNVIWAESVGGNYAWGLDIATDANDNVYVTGGFLDSTITFGTINLTGYPNWGNIFIAKLDNSVTGIINPENSFDRINVFPNPSNGNFYFNGAQTDYKIEVYNLLGEIIYFGKASADNYLVNLTGKARGIYFYRITDTAGLIQDGKIIIE